MAPRSESIFLKNLWLAIAITGHSKGRKTHVNSICAFGNNTP